MHNFGASFEPIFDVRFIGQKKIPWSESASELYRLPLVGEVIANFFRIEGAKWSA
jgi:hypothetical protein